MPLSHPETILSAHSPQALGGSFRDRSGTVFNYKNTVYRQINFNYQKHYCHLMESGLYQRLLSEGLLIPHEVASVSPLDYANCYLVIKPEKVSFVSYPCEWCFGQFKDAALATLKIQKIAMEYGMSLKDASAYNIQFHRGKPVLIDTLSFKMYVKGTPWAAYRQFCEHFLAPIMLMSKVDIGLAKLMRVYLDGIPLHVASSILPTRSYLDLSTFIHIHLHGWAQNNFVRKRSGVARISKLQLSGIIDNLEACIGKLKIKSQKSDWSNYYVENSYNNTAFEHKKDSVKKLVNRVNAKIIWDLGANTGKFSRLASAVGIATIAFDLDPLSVDLNWQQVKAENDLNLLPLVMDLGNPTPGIGWGNQERDSLFSRANADTILALALVHHLVVALNIPLGHIVRFLARLATNIIIEFIPKSDPQFIRLLENREDTYCEYSEKGFETAFQKQFVLREKIALQGSERILYLFSKSS